MKLSDIQEKIDAWYNSPECDEYFANLRKKEEIQEKRFIKFKKYLETHSFDDLMDRLIIEHGKDYRKKCYDKGYEPHPNNKLYFVMDYVKNCQNDIYPDELESDFPFEIHEYKDYYFQTIFGQGAFERIYKKVNNKFELILEL